MIIRHYVIPFLLSGLFHASPHSSSGEWILLDRPTTNDLYGLYFLNNHSGWAVGDAGTILKTTDGGATWINQDTGIQDRVSDIFMLNAQKGWALALQYHFGDTTWFGTAILKTGDGGSQWEIERYPNEFFHSITFLDSTRGWMGGENGKLVGTTDGGNTWFNANVHPSPFSIYPIKKIKFFSDNTGYALGGEYDIVGVIWRTTNSGQSWSTVNAGSEPLNDLWFFDSLSVLCVGGDFERGANIITTSDGGGTWDNAFTGIFGDARAVSFRTPTEGWAPLGFTGTYMVTEDAGTTWMGSYTPDSSRVYDLAFTDSATGFMVGERGTILKYRLFPSGISDEHSMAVPASARLFQNYPNPFNPSTRIRYDLPQQSNVKLAVYNLIGQEVRTLVDGIQIAGMHDVLWDGTDNSGKSVSGGIYFYRMTTNTFSEARKMILLQ